MKRTHIPFYRTYEEAKVADESKLHYFKVVSETETRDFLGYGEYTLYLLADESDPSIQFVAVYSEGYGFVPRDMSVQRFLNLKYDNDMHRLVANNR